MNNIFINILKLLLKVLYEYSEYSIYTKTNNLIKNPTFHYEIVEYNTYSEIPKYLRKKIFLYPIVSTLYYRLNSKKARLLSIDNGRDLIAYGWIQNWEPFKRKFGWIFNNAIMLGPYWTNEKYRGKGIYGDLLQYSLTYIPKDIPVLIYTSINNISSQKGIEKNGFKKIGNFRISLFFRIFSYHKKIV